MLEIKVVGRGVDTLVLNVCYADKQFQPIKQELDADLQEMLSRYFTSWLDRSFPLCTAAFPIEKTMLLAHPHQSSA